MISDYEKAVEILVSQGKFHICLGTERISDVLELIGNPLENLKIVHVAGTNGKGSVCAMLSSVLSCAGYKVGLYTSPHLFEYTERIKINGEDISQDKFAKYIMQACEIAGENAIYLTEFEILTVAAYKYFADEKVDIAIIETGLGGRLDATNVIKSNLLSVITSISIDHKDRLGDTVEKIAFEKAGIVKHGSKVVVGAQNEGFSVIQDRAKEVDSQVVVPDVHVDLEFSDGVNYAVINSEKFEFALLGLWQKDNLELVLQSLEVLATKGFSVSQEAVKEGLKYVKWPARMQYIKEKNIIIDGAHNVDAAKKLIESLDYYFPNKKRRWLYGSLKSKEYEKIVKILFKENDEIFFCQFDKKNSISEKDVKKHVKYEIFPIILDKAENTLNYYDQKCLTIVSGSFYMIGEIFDKFKL